MKKKEVYCEAHFLLFVLYSNKTSFLSKQTFQTGYNEYLKTRN